MRPALIPYAGKERPEPRMGQFHGKTAAMLELWARGFDTYEIAKRCRVSEAWVYRTLSDVRDRERER